MWIEKRNSIIIVIIFAGFLWLGISLFKDYGISWDEGEQRRIGIKTLEYVMRGDPSLFVYRDRYYGTAFELLLIILEKAFKLDNFRSVFFMRHIVTFLVFYTGVIFFYRIIYSRFHSWKIGLLGSLCLILSPRIFADSFYNSKDIPFLSLFIISMYALIGFLEKKTYFKAVLLGLSCALLIDIRIGGIVLPFVTVLLVIGDLLVNRTVKKNTSQLVASLLVYLSSLSVFTILFWPVLWKNPIHHFITSIIKMSHYGWDMEVLYQGRYLKGDNLPWHYIPTWIAITTPIIYSLFFCIGTIILFGLLIKNPLEFFRQRKKDLLFLLWFFLPILSVILLKSVLYDGWRQMFFIYPAFLMLSLVGLSYLWEIIQKRFQGLNYKIIIVVFIFAMAFSLMDTAYFMIRYHPFQNVYFNRLAGKTMQEAKNKFELDYWGLSYRQALEYILKNDTDNIIKVAVANYPGRFNANIFRPDEKKRLKYVDDPEDAKYFISNFRWHKEEYPYKNRYYSININGAEIMVVYKMEGRNKWQLTP